MNISVLSDPEKIGPGLWIKIHTDAITATTDDLKKAFVVNTNALCNGFKCMKCKPHFRKFIDTHPFDQYWNIIDSKGRDIGFFQWTWEMHNQVNKFLGKPQPGLEESYEAYSNTELGACFNCGKASQQASQTQVPEQRSRAIPSILSLYRENGGVAPKPFKMIPKDH